MKHIEFRPLRADEVDCRVQQCTEKGVSILLYKDARCDMNILDETVGNMNWQREHCRDNANCIVSIWDDDKKQWIAKEDTGTESNTEAEKGQASDSFKRSCFNIGIGRELYTAPRIWIYAQDCKSLRPGKGDKYQCYDKFIVTQMNVENKRITGLVIKNLDTGKEVFSYGNLKTSKSAPRRQDTPEEARKNDEMVRTTGEEKIDNIMWNALCSLCNKKNVSPAAVLSQEGLKKPSEMTVKIYNKVVNNLNQM